jgi:predicted nucleotidyltransferase
MKPPTYDLMADSRFPRLLAIAAAQPHPLLFATVSGAHLYGFPSPDSDYDLRGVHVLPADRVVGLDDGPFTIEVAEDHPDLELDLVTHDVKKFFDLMLRRNGYVLEQLWSPLVVHGTSEHDELKAIAVGCVTRHHRHHYRGFAETQWSLFRKDSPPRVKPLLYLYRVLLTGIYLMRTGEVEANLIRLNESFRLPQIPELIARKTEGAEKGVLPEADLDLHEREYHRLVDLLESSAEGSTLPEAPTSRPALHDLLIRLRLRGLGGGRAG